MCKGPEATEGLLELTFPELFSKPCSRGNSGNRGRGWPEAQEKTSKLLFPDSEVYAGRKEEEGWQDIGSLCTCRVGAEVPEEQWSLSEMGGHARQIVSALHLLFFSVFYSLGLEI